MNIEEIRSTLDARFAAREQAIAISRTVIRSSANAIRALHRAEWDKAEGLIGEAREQLDAMTSVVSAHGDLAHSPLVGDAAKEYVEARLTHALFTGEIPPSHTELGVDPVPYLHGLGETVGEMRRRMLDLLRAEELVEASRLLAEMDSIVDLLATLDYPDGMTGGLRRTTDVARSLVERSRSDLTATMVQERLREDLRHR